jgi:DNA-binding transcriptional LysR family regulator
MITDFRLHTFLEVCRQRGFTRAAEVLHITQPAVTQHIQFLERVLGAELFRARGRSLELTAAGELLLRYAETVESDARRTCDRIASLEERRSFRFGATRTIGEYVLPPCIVGWARQFPISGLSMIVDNSDALFQALRGGELDFLFVEGPFERDAYSAETLIRDEIVPVCAPGHHLSGRTVEFSELLGETLLIRELGSGSRVLVEQALALENRRADSFARVLEIGNIGAMKALAASGTGIAFLYGRSVASELSVGTLCRIKVRGFRFIHEYSFVSLARSIYEDEYRSFLDYCRSVLSP